MLKVEEVQGKTPDLEKTTEHKCTRRGDERALAQIPATEEKKFT